jgi:hypothetical protein
MAVAKKRIPIPKFSKTQLDRADLCARACWYGINYTNTKPCVSDAELLLHFASHFYNYHSTKKQPHPNTFLADVNTLIKACGIKMLYRGIADMDFRKGVGAIFTDVYPQYLLALKKPSRVSSFEDAVLCLEKISKGFVKNPASNRLSLASRILFFLSPNMQAFNMNNAVAAYLGLQSRPHVHYREYFEVFDKGLKTNQTLLSKYKIPKKRDALDYKTWYEISKTNWWKRRVLDFAVILNANLGKPIHPLLSSTLNRKIKEETV